ncbi:MAG: beta-ketoacyl-[acyl-carrier-protein] synthase family protein, partial [Candidatus Binatia bacterium]
MTGKTERVVVTGMGVASPLGCNLMDFWDGLTAGKSAVRSLDGGKFSGLHTKIGAVVQGYDEDQYFGVREARRMSRSSQLGLVAAAQAVAYAKLIDGDVIREQVGVMVGSSVGGFNAADPNFLYFYEHGRINPLTIPVSMNIGPGANISIKYGFQGPLVNVDAACSTAAHCIGHAFNLIRSRSLQVAVTGAADSPFSPGVAAAWVALRAVSAREDNPAEACRPFSADRDGMVLG